MEICRVESSKLFYLWQKIVFSLKKRKVSLTKLYQHKNFSPIFSHAASFGLIWTRFETSAAEIYASVQR